MALRSKLTGYAVAIAAALTVLVNAYLKGRSDSKTAQTARDAGSVTKARKIENEVGRLDDSAVDARLAKWMRDKR
ncbi:hypothetical protein CES85_4892 [Ochrobactrum quorumnocens]|uniref:Uncharacterized protein n=1 Tax=Ochrobactrum quorumnocens TaxID=271865 RepID=A0A248UC29_9HYPH|nr:hypothetical protein [[Ochrobactrum] quorumnocens]ASV84100.1 hypothetical protein CES85_4892 [[Ochrobactrum] quorumnocens]